VPGARSRLSNCLLLAARRARPAREVGEPESDHRRGERDDQRATALEERADGDRGEREREDREKSHESVPLHRAQATLVVFDLGA
jgi:hypothetical protein